MQVLPLWCYVRYLGSGIWILFLYVFFVISVLFSLSAYQFQRQIENIYANELSLSMKDTFINHSCDISKMKDAGNETSKTSSIVEIPCLRKNDNEIMYFYTAINILNNYDYLISLYSGRINYTRENIKNYRSEIEIIKDKKPRQMKLLEENIALANLYLTQSIQELDALKSTNKNVLLVVDEGDYYDNVFSFFLRLLGVKHIWQIPNSLLSILLALSMGGLGSLITVTIEYLKITHSMSGNINYSMYIFRPILGSIMALVIYIAVKSGQISISGDDVKELSPFVLSFISILSGLMSEQVYRKLISYGSDVIKKEGGEL